ncbi:hypothetical protein PAMP_000731 [Pampus punctatissimus]
MCVGCGSQIHDQYILRVSPDLEWHAACLKCAECSQYLDETCTCFVRDGKTYCKRDYVRLFGIKCAKCNLGFSSSDLVMRARDNVYHIECFRCSAPHRNHVHKQSEKTTRVRTVLNEKQLHTLRTCYNANPRPDALMKEQLVEMTGLSPRVIRVWFQNKRCKDKKKSILIKQLQQQQHSDKTVSIFNLQGLTGTPLVAGSPIRHESTVQGNPVEVQTYQPPWKALITGHPQQYGTQPGGDVKLGPETDLSVPPLPLQVQLQHDPGPLHVTSSSHRPKIQRGECFYSLTWRRLIEERTD